MREKTHLILLGVIIFLAFLLRFYNLDQVPSSLNWDEVSIGYNAYSILKTGHDEWGEFLPLHFKSFGEYKLPGQIYASILAIALFGLNPLGVRITPVIYGTLTVLFLYFLTKELLRDKKVALLTSFLLAISPWHIQLTRASFESSFALMWVILGIWLLVKGSKNPRWWIFSVLPFIAAIYTYNSARAFIPLFLLVTIFIFRKEIIKSKKYFAVSVALFVLLMIPLAKFVVEGLGAERYKLVSITDEAGLIPRIEEQRNISTLPPIITKLIHNRPVYITFYFAKNYLSHFTPGFLFISGAGHSQHHVQGIGELYLVQAPFLIFGLYLLFKNKEKYRWLTLSWMLLSYVPVAFTMDSIPHALRTLNAAPTYQIISAYGFVIFMKMLKKDSERKIVLSLSLLLLIFQFVGYFDNLFNKYSLKYSRDWQYGNKEAVEYIQKNYDKYDLIVYTREYGEPHIFTLFYLNYPPEKYYENDNLVRFETYDWVRVTNFDKFYFPDLGDTDTTIEKVINENISKKILFIATPEEIPEGFTPIETIKYLDGNVAFEIIESV